MRPRPILLGVLMALLIASSSLAQLANKDNAITLPAAPKSMIPDPGGPKGLDTSQIVYTRIGATEFTPMDSSTEYSDDGIGSLQIHRFSTTPTGVFIATAHLPSGAIPAYLEFDYCNTHATLSPYLIFYYCIWTGDCSITPGVLITGAINGGCYFSAANLTSLAITKDNYLREIVLIAVTPSGSFENSFAGATLGYYLQVSPAPGVATFADVPTSHPFFQYIEALVESGITAGCGGGNYCPNNPVTRGQIAVFLAKALGLHFN